jgi:hypothetical protein
MLQSLSFFLFFGKYLPAKFLPALKPFQQVNVSKTVAHFYEKDKETSVEETEGRCPRSDFICLLNTS